MIFGHWTMVLEGFREFIQTLQIQSIYIFIIFLKLKIY